MEPSSHELASFRVFEEDSAIIYVIDSEYRIQYCNAAWDRFALENGGAYLVRPGIIGRSVMEVTPLVLRRCYVSLYEDVFRTRGQADRQYECSSDRVFRRFHLVVKHVGLPEGGAGLVVINSLALEENFPEGFGEDGKDLRDENGLITMCAHCRRTQIPESDKWRWIPDLVRQMPLSVSHGLGAICFDLHYGS